MRSKKSTLRARILRKQMTDAEIALWRLLRDRRLAGYKFRRQYVSEPYILDFYCSTARLAIEVDGGGHADDNQVVWDHERTAELERRGIRVLRFWNHEVLQQRNAVLESIFEEVRKTPSP